MTAFLTRRVSMTRVLVTVAAISVFAAVACPDLHAATFAVYRGEGATTTLRVTNPTDHSIIWPCSIIVFPCGTPILPEQHINLPADIPPSIGDAGLYQTDVPEGLVVESEITLGSGAVFFMPPITGGADTLRILGATKEGRYNGWIFVAALTPTVVTNLETGDTAPLLAGQGAIMRVAPDGNAHLVAQLGGSIIAFAGINNQDNGSNAGPIRSY